MALDEMGGFCDNESMLWMMQHCQTPLRHKMHDRETRRRRLKLVRRGLCCVNKDELRNVSCMPRQPRRRLKKASLPSRGTARSFVPEKQATFRLGKDLQLLSVYPKTVKNHVNFQIVIFHNVAPAERLGKSSDRSWFCFG
jgi:hypothetical protein